MATRIKWTDEEDEILVQAIKANPHNKAEAFRVAASQVNHNECCCSNRWYKILSNPEHRKYVGCMFTLVGIHSKLDNITVNRDKVHITPDKTKRGIWTKIKNLLGL